MRRARKEEKSERPSEINHSNIISNLAPGGLRLIMPGGHRSYHMPPGYGAFSFLKLRMRPRVAQVLSRPCASGACRARALSVTRSGRDAILSVTTCAV